MILVAYASRYGSTREIAHCIYEQLIEKTAQAVTFADASEVRDLSPYQVVVLGSAIYEHNWLDPIHDLLVSHEQELAEKELWLFSSGPVEAGDPEAILGGWKVPQVLKPLVERLKPRGITVFSGKFDADRLSMDDWCIARDLRSEHADYRDWEAIRSWAGEIAKHACLH